MDLPVEQWRSLQLAMKEKVKLYDDFDWTLEKAGALKYVGGVDISKEKDGELGAERAVAALVVLSFPDLQVVYEDFEELDLSIPYKACFLGFRECPAYGKLVERVQQTPYNPQVILVDGFGILHPRRCGSATQLGVETGYPTIGVAKALLHTDGLDQRQIRDQCSNMLSGKTTEGMQALELDLVSEKQNGDILGRAVFGYCGTTNPIYVSQGHRISLQTAVELVKRCCLFRVPEPIRQADVRSRYQLSLTD